MIIMIVFNHVTIIEQMLCELPLKSDSVLHRLCAVVHFRSEKSDDDLALFTFARLQFAAFRWRRVDDRESLLRRQ